MKNISKTEDEDTRDANTRMVAAAVKAAKEAELEDKRKRRKESEAKKKDTKIQIQSRITDLGNGVLNNIFFDYKHYYDPVVLKGRYKEPYRKHREGYLIKMRKYISSTEGYKPIIAEEGLTLTENYHGCEVGILNVVADVTIIRHQQNAYVSFSPTLDGMLGLSAVLAVFYNEYEMFNRVVEVVLERELSVDTGNIDLAGYDTQIERCMNIITVEDPRISNRHILLAGPPGCGKSMIAKEVIKRTPNWFHFNVSVQQGFEKYIPMLHRILKHSDRKLIVFIDEIDELGLNRDVNRSSVYQLLRLLDGVSDSSNVKFFATTNRPGDLDAALLRVGRFGPIMIIDRPEYQQSKKIVAYYTKKFDAEHIDSEAVIKGMSGITGSDIRAGFEDCIIFKQELTTKNIRNNIKEIMKNNQSQGEMYA